MSQQTLFTKPAFRILLALGALTVVAGVARAQSAPARHLEEAAELIAAFTDSGPDSIPNELLERAQGIAVIPNVFRGGFILGARRGRGVLSLRLPDGSWSNPAFVTLTGGSIGWQIGLESVDLVLLVMNKGGVDELLEDRFTLGGTASVAAGPVGRQADAATNAQLSSQILAYSRAKGLFAGATLEGAALNADDDANADFYGVEEIGLRDVLSRAATATPQMAATWRATLGRITGGAAR